MWPQSWDLDPGVDRGTGIISSKYSYQFCRENPDDFESRKKCDCSHGIGEQLFSSAVILEYEYVLPQWPSRIKMDQDRIITSKSSSVTWLNLERSWLYRPSWRSRGWQNHILKVLLGWRSQDRMKCLKILLRWEKKCLKVTLSAVVSVRSRCHQTFTDQRAGLESYPQSTLQLSFWGSGVQIPAPGLEIVDKVFHQILIWTQHGEGD